MPNTLSEWLAHCAAQHPKTMDLSLERTVAVARRLGIAFSVPVITVAGTNGKGSTCAMLESIARHAGYRVGLYQKPELVHFEERCRVGGEAVAAEALVPHFAAVEQARLNGDPITLTQFEFSTLAIARLLSLAPLDLVILEVGLGGRYDSVNAFDTDCAVITSIDLDHTEWLGPDRESIGLEKAQVMRPGKPVIVSDPVPPASVVAHAGAIGADLWLVGRDFNHAGDRQQWGWSGRGRRYHGLSYPALRGANQLLNAAGAIAALQALRDRLPITAQAVRTGLAMVELPGRFQIVPGQPALVLDVAHNPQAVAALALNLDAMGFFPRTHAVFGAMRDKDIPGLLARLLPLVDVWHCCSLPPERAATADELAAWVRAAYAAQPTTAAQSTVPTASTTRGALAPAAALTPSATPASVAPAPRGATPAAAVQPPGHNPAPILRKPATVEVHTHASPSAALRSAAAAADPADRIVVFGSFHTVGGVLKDGLPRLAATHLS